MKLKSLVLDVYLRALLLLVLVATYSSCTKGHQPGQALEPAKTDYFEKKQKCAAYIDKVSAELKADNSEDSSFYYSGQTQAYDYRFLKKVCFSIEMNTCAAFIEIWHFQKEHGVKKQTGEELKVHDLLTHTLLASAIDDYTTPKKERQEKLKEYRATVMAINNDIKCAE